MHLDLFILMYKNERIKALKQFQRKKKKKGERALRNLTKTPTYIFQKIIFKIFSMFSLCKKIVQEQIAEKNHHFYNLFLVTFSFFLSNIPQEFLGKKRYAH